MITKPGASLLTILLFGALLIPSFALSSNSGIGSGQGGVSSHVELQLDDQSQYAEAGQSSSGVINKISQMKGIGENSMTVSVSGDGYSASNTVEGSGAVSATNTVLASTDGGSANQKASVSGESGFISSSSTSRQNTMYVAGGFEGEGYLNSDITAQGGSTAATTGNADIMGVNCLDGERSQYLASNEMAMTVNGLHLTSSGEIGQFGFSAANVKTDGRLEGRDRSDAKIVPGTYAYYNDPRAWVPAGWRWPNNPNINLYLKTDDNLQAEMLDASSVSNAILVAAKTWDDATSQILFANGVTQSSTVSADTLDGNNVHAWIYDDSEALGYSTTWYYRYQYVTGADRKRYWKAVESDVSYNTAYSWTTDGTATDMATVTEETLLSDIVLDVQTVALHELGHTIGLGDTYLNKVYKYDLAQIMGFYDNPQRVLGAGDTTGVKTLYGK